MPFAISEGARIFYRLEGAPEKPLLVLAHSLGVDHGLWDPQLPALLRYVQVLRVDLRGHGASDSPAGDYTIEQLGRDVIAAVDSTARERFAYCGLSLGGMIGQWLGANATERITHLVLANTSPRVGAPDLFEARRKAVLEGGMTSVENAAMERFFSPRVLASANPQVATSRAALLAANPVGYAGCCAAIRDMDQRALLGRIRVPTLIIGGCLDASTPWEGHGDLLATAIPGARSIVLEAAHLSNVELPSAFTNALFDFLLPPQSNDRLAAGFTMRRSILGDAHVDRAVANTTELTRDFQDLITRYAWGTVWTRPGLDPKVRRLLVLAMTASLGRWEEFRLHLRAGLAAGLEMPDLEEVLLQVAIYAGVPAANTAFQIASEK
jgi:3-oxoadipate enol-lactonase / 4-carboxymuconolactone decarboxylase